MATDTELAGQGTQRSEAGTSRMRRRARASSPPRPAAATTTSPRPSAARRVYEDVTVDVQPDPDRHLLQGWIYGFADGTAGYPQEWTAAEVLQLAPVPRSQRGVGADDLSQQRQRRPPDQPKPRQRQGGATRSTSWNSRLGHRRRAPRQRMGARRARDRDARLSAGAARRADEHDQQRAVGRLGAQAALRPGPDPLQPRALRVRSTASTAPRTRRRGSTTRSGRACARTSSS